MGNNWEDVTTPQLWLGRPGDFDTPMLPGFDIDIGTQEPHAAFNYPGWRFVLEGHFPRTGGTAQRRSVGWRTSEVRVHVSSKLGGSDAVLVEVHGSRDWRQIVTRAVQKAYYDRAVYSREAA